MGFELDPVIEALIKSKCDLDKNGKLQRRNADGINEKSIFEEACKSFNENTFDFTINGEEFNVLQLMQVDIDYEPKAFTEYKKKLPVTVSKNVLGRDVSFTYNLAGLEDWVINHGTDSNGDSIDYFKNIPEIRNKKEDERTEEEKNRLNEFENLIKYVVDIGTEYGVDPNLILAIIQRETCFQGLGQASVKGNGNGYMQITPAPIKDMIGGSTVNKKLVWSDKPKTKIFGDEIVEIFRNIGFDPEIPAGKKKELCDKIMDYIRDNNDPEFNIRVGTLLLRRLLKKENDNIYDVAFAYNGNKKNLTLRINYSKAVSKFYEEIKNHKVE